MITFFGGGLFIFIRDKPSSPPSAVAELNAPPAKMCKVIGEALKERTYVLLICVFASLEGIFVSMASLLSIVFSYYNVPGEPPAFGTAVIALYGGAVTIGGVGASFVCAFLLQKYQKFLIPIRVICVCTCICFITGFWVLPSLNKVVVGINIFMLGVFLVPIIPVSMNFASELTFPIAPAATNGMLLMFGHGTGAVLGIVGTPLCQANPLYLIGLYLVLGVFCVVCSMFMVENLKKLEFTKKQAALKALGLDIDSSSDPLVQRFPADSD